MYNFDLLKMCIMYGISPKNACEFADIPYTEYQKILKNDENFLNELRQSKNMLKLKAMQNIAEKIFEGNIPESKYFLEKCCDFSFGIGVRQKKEQSDNSYERKLKKLSDRELEDIVFYDEKN